MPAPTPLPDLLNGRVFSVAEASALGLSRRVLQGRRVVMVTPGYYRYADSAISFDEAVRAAIKVLPGDAALSHMSNLRWRGFNIRQEVPLHFATNSRTRRFHDEIALHRYLHPLYPTLVRGVPLLGPDRTFVDCATILSVRELVRIGDWLVAQGQTDLRTLRDYVLQSHLDGVQRARRAASLVRGAVESPLESDVRVMLARAGLPEPEINTDIADERGTFLARGDMVYREWKVLVEYDGWQHERDARQRQRDHLRREALESAGWRVIVVTIADMREADVIAARVRRALMARGYRP